MAASPSNFLLLLLAVVLFNYGADGQDLNVGPLDTANTVFNVGDGNTDVPTNLNRIAFSNSGYHGSTDPAEVTTGGIYYAARIKAPGCVDIPASDAGVVTPGTNGYNGLFNADGFGFVGQIIQVNAWAGTVFDVSGKFGICLEADILLKQQDGTGAVMDSRNFDLEVNILDSSFQTSSGQGTNQIVTDTDTSENSGTGVTVVLDSPDPLGRGAPLYFHCTPTVSTYQLTGFSSVTVDIFDAGANPGDPPVQSIPVIAASNIQDAGLTWFYFSGTTPFVRHYIPLNAFAAQSRTLQVSGVATYTYVGRRGLRELNHEDEEEETFDPGFSVHLQLAAISDDAEATSGGGTTRNEATAFFLTATTAFGAFLFAAIG